MIFLKKMGQRGDGIQLRSYSEPYGNENPIVQVGFGLLIVTDRNRMQDLMQLTLYLAEFSNEGLL